MLFAFILINLIAPGFDNLNTLVPTSVPPKAVKASSAVVEPVPPFAIATVPVTLAAVPLTFPVTLPVTLPVTSPVTLPVKLPVTSPVTSPVTLPVTLPVKGPEKASEVTVLSKNALLKF